jgi:hypothetical protein
MQMAVREHGKVGHQSNSWQPLTSGGISILTKYESRYLAYAGKFSSNPLGQHWWDDEVPAIPETENSYLSLIKLSIDEIIKSIPYLFLC